MILAMKGAIATSGEGWPYKWVIGQDSYVYVSTETDGSNRTAYQVFTGANYEIYGVATNAVDTWVVVAEGGKIAYSSDAENWTEATSPFGGTDILDVCFADGYFVAVGLSQKMAYSTDGISWTLGGTFTGDLCSVAWGDGLWVVGDQQQFRTATTPTGTWTQRTSSFATATRPRSYYSPDVAIWVAGYDNTSTSNMASSSDGITWNARSGLNAGLGTGVYNKTGFASYGGTIVNAVATSLTTFDIQTSSNGTSWTNQTPASSTGWSPTIAVDGSGNYVLVTYSGSSSNVQSSSDGINWTTQGTMLKASSICHSLGIPAIR